MSEEVSKLKTYQTRRWALGCFIVTIILGCTGLLLPLLPMIPGRGITIAWEPVKIRPAILADPVDEHYFSTTPGEDIPFQGNVVVAEGTFSKRTWLTAVLYVVRSGEAKELDALSLGRSPNRFGEPTWITMQITLALGNVEQVGGRVTHLGAFGQTRGGGQGGVEVVHNINPLATKVLATELTATTLQIVYVEGDREPEVTSGMTVEEFAKINGGNFLVLAAGFVAVVVNTHY